MKARSYVLTLFAAVFVLVSCKNGRQPATTDNIEPDTVYRWNGLREVAVTDLRQNPVEMIADRWMLITSGDANNFNTMTASWGALGQIWSRPVAIITVRNTRYTYEFLQENDIFTLSFFDEEQREALALLGSRSGRDGDKVAESGLTPMETPEGSMAFEQARIIMECRKIYENPLDPRSIFDDEIAEIYIKNPGDRHVMFIGEILRVWAADQECDF